MSALPVPTFAATPDPTVWLLAFDAAGRLACHPGHLTRRCKDELARRGLAVKAADPSRPGPDRWYVSRSIDPRLSPDAPAHVGLGEPDLSGYTGRQRTLALQRRACVERFRQAKREDRRPVKQWLPGLLDRLGVEFPDLRVSRSRLYGWDAAYGGPADTARLIDARGGDRRSSSGAAAWDYFRSLYLHQNQPSVAFVWEEVRRRAAEEGWGWCSLPRCRAQLDRRIPPEVQLRHRDPTQWKRTLRPYIAQDPESWPAGEHWVGDHKQLDLWCRWGTSVIRPWVTAWIDWRTRRLAGWVLSDSPNSSTILAALRHGLLDPANMGGPSTIVIDNGKDYDAWVFHGQTKRERRARVKPAVDEGAAYGIFRALSIEAHFSLPFNPNGKARMERWFRTLGAFCRTFDTYAGEDVASRPERLNAVLKNPAAVPAFEHVRERLGRFIDGDNADAAHNIPDLSDGGERVSANEAMARWRQTRRVVNPAALDALLMQWHRPVTVGRNGITLTLAGAAVSYGQHEPALMPFKAARKGDRPAVLVSYDPHDIRTVRVHDGRWQFVCLASMNQLGGARRGDPIGLRHVAELNRQQAQYQKALGRVNADRGIVGVLTREEQLADLAARQARPAPRPPPPPPPKRRPA
jgi:putative transposase